MIENMSALNIKPSESAKGPTLDEMVHNIVINDEKWRCIVTMLVETFQSQTKYTSILNGACAKGCRKVIYNISKENMFATVRSILTDNYAFVAKPSRFLQQIRQCAENAIRSKNSDHLLDAAIIKWLIYEARLESVARNSAECEAAVARKREMFTVIEKPIGDETKSKTGKESGKIVTGVRRVSSARRANSKLRKRGEEWTDRIYVDDAPLGGPDMYILLIGFYESELPNCLSNMGVPLRCILKLEHFRNDESDIVNFNRVASADLTDSEISRVFESQSCPEKFWKYFEPRELRDIAVRPFCPTFNEETDPSDIYDGISYMLYDMHNMLQAHAEYLASMKVVQVQDVPSRELQRGDTVYEAIINHVPEEAMGVSQIVEAMLRQVEENLKKNNAEMKFQNGNSDDDNTLNATVASSACHSRNSDRYLKEQTRGTNDVYDKQRRLSSSFADASTIPVPKSSTLPAAGGTSSSATSLSKVNSAAFARLADKLRLLNLKYELISLADDSSSRRPSPELELILHGDSLRLNACCANDEENPPREASLKASAKRSEQPGWKLSSFRVNLSPEEPRIAKVWTEISSKGLEELENCKTHLPRIFEYSKKKNIDESRAKHLLNLLGFQRILESRHFRPAILENSSSKSNTEDPLQNRSDMQKMPIIMNDAFSTLTEENSRQSNTLTVLNNANHILKKLNFEKKKSYAQPQRCIIFDEIVEKSTIPPSTKLISFSNSKPELSVTMSKNAAPPVSLDVSYRRQGLSMKVNLPTSSIERSFSSDDQHQFENASEVLTRVSSLNSSPSGNDCDGCGCEYSHSLRSFELRSGLFGLIDATAMALGSQLQCPMALEEFEDAELLAPSAFLQIVRDCFQDSADGDVVAVARHFAPTDSILLLFGDEPGCLGETIRKDITCVLRTPVCLSDFCEFVVDEEQDWLNKRRQCLTKASAPSERCRKQVLGGCDENVQSIFRDEDFFLPRSLKACIKRELRKQEEDNILETKSFLMQTRETSMISRMPSSRSTSDTKIMLRKKLNNPEEKLRISLSTGNRLSDSPFNDDSESTDFIGYDLGIELYQRRAQVSNVCRNWISQVDGTRLRLTYERWCLGGAEIPSSISINVTIPKRRGENEGAWHFKYHEIKGQEVKSLFHVVMSNGIIVAFSRLQSEPNKLLYEIQISWPSGLIIKPVEYKDADYPFYILQYYTSTASSRENIKDEKYRKYLYNGDVVKFLTDGSIIVLRPNGIIITLLNFEEESDATDPPPVPELILQQSTQAFRKSSSEMVYPAPLRYVVLELNGRRYEVREGRGQRELDRLCASVAENYSRQEKFSSRADGTDALFNDNAELVVNFPDGTRILSGCNFEEKLIYCDWSPSELNMFFEDNEEPDGFVSISVFSRVEHPNYATVFYGFGNECCISMCGGSLELEPRGTHRLTCDDNQVQITLDNDTVSVIRNSSCDCHNIHTSKTTFYLIDDKSMTNTLSSEIFNHRLLMTFCDSATYLSVRRDNIDFEITSIAPNSTGEVPWICSCGKRKNECTRSGYRLFAVNRKGEACEYHHRSVWWQYSEKLMSKQEGASLVHRPIRDRMEMKYRLGLLPLDFKRSWTLNYQIPKAKPSLKYRLVYGSGEDSEEYEQPLKASVGSTVLGQRRVRFLMARLFEGIGHHAENSLISMQKALLNYWCELATGMSNENDVKDECNESLETCYCPEDTWDCLMGNINTDKITSIPMEMYESGRQYLREMKLQRDAQRTRQTIDRYYSQNATPDECPYCPRLG